LGVVFNYQPKFHGGKEYRPAACRQIANERRATATD
jgi:hypothetical protein